jgi:hypothetical protein
VRDKGNGIVAESSNDLSELLLDEEGLRKRINQFRDNKEYGPYLLEENDAIVDILAGDKSASKTTVECFSLADRLMKLFLCAYTPLEKLRRRKNQ